MSLISTICLQATNRLDRRVLWLGIGVLVVASFFWWGIAVPGRYLHESNPADSFGAHGANFIDISRDGTGVMWEPISGFDDQPRALRFTENFRTFTIEGFDPFRLRTVPTTEHELKSQFALLKLTITSDPSQTSAPGARSYLYSKVLIPPAITLSDIGLFSTILAPCAVWLMYGFIIHSRRTLRVWSAVSIVLLAIYCFPLFAILGFCDLFHRIPKYSWMPFLCFFVSMLGLFYLKSRASDSLIRPSPDPRLLEP